MTSNYNKTKFSKEELEWAISLVEAEFEKEERNTPEKMSAIIRANFDVKCDANDIANYFNLNQNYERESKRIGVGYSLEYQAYPRTGAYH